MAICLRVERTILSAPRFMFLIFLMPWRHIILTCVIIMFFLLVCLLRVALDLERRLVHGGFWLFVGGAFEVDVGGVDVCFVFLLPIIRKSHIRMSQVIKVPNSSVHLVFILLRHPPQLIIFLAAKSKGIALSEVGDAGKVGGSRRFTPLIKTVRHNLFVKHPLLHFGRVSL